MAEEVYDNPKILTVLLPHGEKVLYKCDSRCPMMDLLVQITSVAKLKPTLYEIQPLSDDGDDAIVLPFNPNTQIGSIDTQVVRIALRTSGSAKYRLNSTADRNLSGPATSSKGSTDFKNRVSDFNKLSGTSAIKICNNPESMNRLLQPVIPSRNNYIASTLTPVVSGGTIGVSCRVRVRLPQEQIHVVRAAPQYPLQELFDLVCDERQLDPTKHVLVYTDDISKAVNLTQTLKECGTTELTMKALVNSLPTKTNIIKKTKNSSKIFTFLKNSITMKPAPSHANQNGTSSQGSSRRSSSTSSISEAIARNGTRPSTIRSMERLPNLHTIPNIHADEFKMSKPCKFPTKTTKRQAPPPPSTVVNQVNDQKDGSPSDDVIRWQDLATHKRSQCTSDTVDAENFKKFNSSIPRSVSIGALDRSVPPQAMPRKKRAAPTPPMCMSHEDLRTPALFEVQLCEKLDNIEERDIKSENPKNPEPTLASRVTDEVSPEIIIRHEVAPPERKAVEELIGKENTLAGLVEVVPEEEKQDELIPNLKEIPVEAIIPTEEVSPEMIIRNDSTELPKEEPLKLSIRNENEIIIVENPIEIILQDKIQIPTHEIAKNITPQNDNETKISTEQKPGEIIIEKREINIDINANTYSRRMLDITCSPIVANNLEPEVTAKETHFPDEKPSSSSEIDMKKSSPLPADEALSFTPTSSSITFDRNNETYTLCKDNFVSPQTLSLENIQGSREINLSNKIVTDNSISEETQSPTVESHLTVVDDVPTEYVTVDKYFSEIATKAIKESPQNNENSTTSETDNICENNSILPVMKRQECKEKVHKQLGKSQNDSNVDNTCSIYISNNSVIEKNHSPTSESLLSTKPIIIEEVYKSPNQPIVVVEMLKYKNSFTDTKHTLVDDEQNEHSNKYIVDSNKSYGNKFSLNQTYNKQSDITVYNNVNGVKEDIIKGTTDVINDAKAHITPPPPRIYTPPKFMLTTWVDDKKPANASWDTKENEEKIVHKKSANTTSPIKNSQAETTSTMSINKVALKTVNKTDTKIVNNNAFPKDHIIPQVVGVIKRNQNNNYVTNGVKSTPNRNTLSGESELTAVKNLLRSVRTNSLNGSSDLPKVNGSSGSVADKTALHSELMSHFIKIPDLSESTPKNQLKKTSPKMEAPLTYMVSLPDYHNQAWRDRLNLMKPVLRRQLSMKDVAEVVKPLHADNNHSQLLSSQREAGDSPPSWILVKDANNLIQRNQSFGKNT